MKVVLSKLNFFCVSIMVTSLCLIGQSDEDDVKDIMTKGLKAVSPIEKLVTAWGAIKASSDEN
jgi:hypothetical protein